MLKPFILTPALLDSTSNHFISQVPALLCIRWVKMNNTLMNLVGLGNSTRSHPKLCTVWSYVPVTYFFSHAVHIGWEGNLLIAGFVPSRHSWTVSDYDTAKFLIYSISRRHLISAVLKLGDALAGACCYTVCALSNILVQSENLS